MTKSLRRLRLAGWGALVLGSTASLWSAPAVAHGADFHPSPTAKRYTGEVRNAASRFLADESTSLGLAAIELSVDRVVPSAHRQTVRFGQTHLGIPVLGSATAVRLGSGGEVTLAVVDVARGLTVDPTPIVSELEAVAWVEDDLGYVLATPPSPTLAVLPDPSMGGRLVWVVDVPDARGGTRSLVDAHIGGIVTQRSLAHEVEGRVYAISKVVTPATADVELTGLDVAAPQKLNGWGGQLVVANYVSGGSQGGDVVIEQELLPNVGEDFHYDPPVDPLDAADGFAQVGVFHHLTRMRDYFATGHGIDMSAPSWGLVAVSNMRDGGAPLDNAYFSPMGIGAPWNKPNLIGIGQGSAFDFADDSDVFLHEFGHYVSHNAVGYNQGQVGVDEYGLSPFGGSIDEGISDYFACTENDDPVLGEASLALLGGGRDLTDTSKRCPTDILGEVHADGEIIGSFAWSLREALGAAVADKLVWGAVTLLTPKASLGDFASGVLATAGDLVTSGELTAGDVTTIEGLIADRGLDACGRVLEVSDDAPQSANLIGLDVLGQGFGGADCASLKGFGISLQSLFHYEHTPAAGTESVRFSVDLSGGGGELDWSLYVRKGQHVTFSAAGGFLPTVAQFDHSVESITTDSGEIVIDASSDPPFDPAATYYMVVAHANCPTTLATITAGEAAPSTGQGGAGGTGGAPAAGGQGTGAGAAAPPGPEDEESDGCGCRAAGADPTNPIPWLIGTALLGAAAWRRRRGR